MDRPESETKRGIRFLPSSFSFADLRSSVRDPRGLLQAVDEFLVSFRAKPLCQAVLHCFTMLYRKNCFRMLQVRFQNLLMTSFLDSLSDYQVCSGAPPNRMCSWPSPSDVHWHGWSCPSVHCTLRHLRLQMRTCQMAPGFARRPKTKPGRLQLHPVDPVTTIVGNQWLPRLKP